MLSIASGMETLLQTVSAKKGSLNSLASLSEQTVWGLQTWLDLGTKAMPSRVLWSSSSLFPTPFQPQWKELPLPNR